MRLNCASTLTHWGNQYPQKVAVTIRDRTVTYSSLNQRTDELAELLTSRHVVADDRVAILFPSSHEFIEALYATLKVGGVVVPLTFLLNPDQLARMTVDSSSKAI